MPRHFQTYWYHESKHIEDAFLYNCRDADLYPDVSSLIPLGTIVLGQVGWAVAEQVIPKFGATITSPDFRPNRKCEWQGYILACMAHSQTPQAKVSRKALRLYNCIVAELTNDSAIHAAKQAGITVITSAKGKKLINLELSTFQKQSKIRRAALL